MSVKSRAASAQYQTNQRGATMVEFAIGAVTFFFLLIGGIEVARYLYTVQRVQHVLNELSRASIMGRLPEHDQCPQSGIDASCRAMSMATFLKDRYSALKMALEDGTQLGMCANVSAGAAACKNAINARNDRNVCRPKSNSCNGLDAGGADSANQYVYIEILQPIDLFLHVITVPIKAGVVVKNEPFQEEGA